jgi:hypothetical protein
VEKEMTAFDRAWNVIKMKMCYFDNCTNVATTEAVRLIGGELRVVPACETCAEWILHTQWRNNITGGGE